MLPSRYTYKVSCGGVRLVCGVPLHPPTHTHTPSSTGCLCLYTSSEINALSDFVSCWLIPVYCLYVAVCASLFLVCL